MRLAGRLWGLRGRWGLFPSRGVRGVRGRRLGFVRVLLLRRLSVKYGGGLVSWSREWVDGCRETYVFEVVGFYFWGRGVWGFCGGGFEADVVFACEGLRRG